MRDFCEVKFFATGEDAFAGKPRSYGFCVVYKFIDREPVERGLPAKNDNAV